MFLRRLKYRPVGFYTVISQAARYIAALLYCDQQSQWENRYFDPLYRSETRENFITKIG